MSEAALLQAIIDSPDDDRLRLVYADFLEERGEATRAEFIRVQIELARLPEKAERRASLEAKERELLAAFADEWEKPLVDVLRTMMTSVEFRRGFSEGITVEAEGLISNAEAIFAIAPIRSLTIYLGRDRMAEVAVLPQLARLERLNLHGNMLTDADVAHLASSPHVGRLKELILSWNEIGAEGARALATSPHLSRLVVLDVVQGQQNLIPINAASLLVDRFGEALRIAAE